ncbi:winged helix-turn-helix domain-containing protein [Corynebacterium sp. HMSC078A10]|uniref:winged helix-turn-helix domain-containing protein n=1 Tax=Corynebacterium sp. HMSC078A10 TaxID=1739312 RepID=UPI001FF07BFA|nr:winged helix-turn-helix domain-containing protein [Corynebacterium sp. HMSC078A10]
MNPYPPALSKENSNGNFEVAWIHGSGASRIGVKWRGFKRSVLIEEAAVRVGITDEERLETIASGQPLYENRIGWALTFLKKANAITSPARARFQITDFGRDLLARDPSGLTEKQLLGEIAGTEAALTWRGRNPGCKAGDEVSADKQSVLPEAESELDPVEQVETGVSRNNEFVAGELLTRLHDNEPAFFEQAVLDLLMAMGYVLRPAIW